jgi:hypothetical protein
MRYLALVIAILDIYPSDSRQGNLGTPWATQKPIHLACALLLQVMLDDSMDLA